MNNAADFGDGVGSARVRVRLKGAAKGTPRAHFDAARHRRRLSGWNASTNNMRAMLAQDGDLLRARSRDLVRNNPHAASAASSFVSNLVGAGIKPSSLVQDRDLRETINALWLAWTDEADADGVTDFYGMQAMAAQQLFEAGEVFFRFRPRRLKDGLTVPLQLQMLESDMLDYTWNTVADNGNEVINGIEFNGQGQRVAYHFWVRHPGDIKMLPLNDPRLRVRVPAEEVLHIFRPLRPGQIRGVPWCAAAIVKLWMLDQYDDAELDRKKTAAMYAGFITSPAPDDLMGPDVEDGDDPAEGLVTLEPGTMQALLPGEQVQFSNPAEVGATYEPFQYRNLLASFAAMGVPYPIGTHDLRSVNYSSIRSCMVEYRRRLEQVQHGVIIFQLCRPVWVRWMQAAVIAGALQIRDFARSPAKSLVVRWLAPKFEWVDPLKDLQAEKLAVDSGFKARSDVIEAEGYDPEETDARIKADRDREKQLGLQFPTVFGARAPIGTDEDETGTGGQQKSSEDQSKAA